MPNATIVNPRRRIAAYLVLGLGLTLVYALLRGSDWRGSADLHTHMEAVATLLAFIVGVIALVRFHAKKSNTFLFVGTGFLGTAFLDGYHAVVTSHYFQALLPSELGSLIPWSWAASRMFLSVMLALSWYAWRRQQRLGDAGQVGEKAVYLFSAAFTFASFLFFAFVPLPRAYYPELWFHRPEEFIPALFFLIALVGYLRKGAWRHDAFEHWLVLSLIVGLVSQAVFMSYSGTLFDFEFDAAHTLKKVGYICVLTGLLISMYTIFKTVEANADVLKFQIAEREQAESALAESEQKFRHYTEVASDWVWEMDPDQRFSSVSERITETSGLPPSAYIGKTRKEVAVRGCSANWESHFSDFESRRPFRDFEFQMATAGNDVAWVSTRGEPYYDRNGNFAGYRGVGTDITERKEAEQALRDSEARASAVVDTAVDGVIIIDQWGGVQTFNPASEEMFGYRAEEVVGQNIKMLMPSPQHEEHDGYLQNYLDSGVAKVIGKDRELVGRRKNGSLFPMDLAVSETWQDRERVFVGIVRDVTERKIAEEALGRRAAELERSNAELQQFAYVASHDLQEPLRKIQAFGDRLKSKYGDALDERGQDYLTRMQDAANRMQALIQSLLSFSRVSSKARPLVPVDLNAVVREVVGDLEVRIQETGAEVQITDLPTIEADPTQIRQLLQNLIGNALKYHQRDTPPVVEVSGEIENGAVGTVNGMSSEVCRLFVQDNGIGFEPEFAERIFGIFQRLHGRGEFEGTGVGLAICRKIAERHGGSIVAEGRPGEGAKFIITLPMPSARVAA